MTKPILILTTLLALNGCAATMQGVAQDSSKAIDSAAEFAHKNRDALNTAATQTGELIKRGGNLIGKGIEATGEILQDMTE